VQDRVNRDDGLLYRSGMQKDLKIPVMSATPDDGPVSTSEKEMKAATQESLA
jgi:hypothetical protein